MNRVAYLARHWVPVATLMIGVCGLTSRLAARPQRAKAKIFGQRLVEEIHAKHVEADEIGIAIRSSRGCKTIASTDPGDIGEACEKDDSEPMRTGKPYVEKEKDGYDISVPLRDATGKLIGSAGIGFKPEAGQTEASLVQRAERIAAEMQAQIPSQARLMERLK